jgi:hypothetical protein
VHIYVKHTFEVQYILMSAHCKEDMSLFLLLYSKCLTNNNPHICRCPTNKNRETSAMLIQKSKANDQRIVGFLSEKWKMSSLQRVIIKRLPVYDQYQENVKS